MDGGHEGRRGAGPEEQKNTAQVGGEAQLSIKYDQNYVPYVIIETDILAGVSKSEWVKTVKDHLRKKFPDGVTIGRNVIEIDYQSRMEMTYSKYTQRLMQTEPDMYADKLRSTHNADEILKASRNWVNEAPIHPRSDNIQEFARGEVLLRIGGKDYSAQVVVAMRSNGRLLMYDMLKIKPTTIQDKKMKSGAAITKNPSPGTDRSTALGFKGSIPQDSGERNTNFSLRQSEDGKQSPDGGGIVYMLKNAEKRLIPYSDLWRAPITRQKKKSATSMPVRDTARGKTSETLEGYSSSVPSISQDNENSEYSLQGKNSNGTMGEAKYSLTGGR